MTSQDIMDDAREKEAADRSGEWLEQEVELEELSKQNNNNTRREAKNTHVNSSNTSSTGPSQEISQMTSDRFFSATSEQQTSQILLPPKNKKKEKEHIPKGTIVSVQARTWPGVNKQGGVGRIVKAHINFDAGVKYDVAYVLGGREKMVDAIFVRVHDDSAAGSFTPSEALDIDTDAGISNGSRIAKRRRGDKFEEDSISTRGGSTGAPARKSRRVGERKQVEEWIALIDAEEESKLNENGSASVSSVSTRSRRKSVKREDIEVLKEKESSATKNIARSRRVDKETKADREKLTKKRESRPKETKVKSLTLPEKSARKSKRQSKETKPKALPEPKTDDKATFSLPPPKDFHAFLASMTFTNIIESAASYYSTVLSKEKSVGKKKKAIKTVFITCSCLSTEEKSIVQRTVKEVSNDKVKIKLLNDFNPYKTSVLVTSIIDQGEDEEKVAKLRTMKAMRSAINGVPIVDVSWCEACLASKEIVAPNANHSITSLPTREAFYMNNWKMCNGIDAKREFSTAAYGVSSLAVCHYLGSGQNPVKLFQNTSVFLCGSGWKDNATKAKDVQLLMNEGGGRVLMSATQAIQTIKDFSTGENNKIILLCDDSLPNSTNGISSTLARAVRQIYDVTYDRHKPVLTVNPNWLFDSISCAKILEGDRYEPKSPLANSLWRLSCDEEEETSQG